MFNNTQYMTLCGDARESVRRPHLLPFKYICMYVYIVETYYLEKLS